MSCSCGCSPCSCSPVNCNISPCIIQLPDNPAQELTFENVNLAGIGFLNGVDGTNVEFRGLASESLALTVSLDAPNNTIILDFDDSLLIADIPTASETERGIAEVATQAETNAGIVDNVIVTPAKLEGRTATETRAGIAEIATQAETTTGTDDTRIITPLKLATYVASVSSTRVFADAVARAAATPNFDGQLGVQLNTNVPYAANGTSAGDFNVPILIDGANILSAALSFDTTGYSVTFSGTGSVVINTSGAFAVTQNATFTGGVTQLGNGSGEFVNFEGAKIQINGATMANDMLLSTNGSADLEEIAINTFLSTSNVQTGWSVTNPSVTRTLDVASADLATTRAVLGTLINDLKAVLLPAT